MDLSAASGLDRQVYVVLELCCAILKHILDWLERRHCAEACRLSATCAQQHNAVRFERGRWRSVAIAEARVALNGSGKKATTQLPRSSGGEGEGRRLHEQNLGG